VADITLDGALLRYELIREENEEYLEACREGNLTEIADALGDQLYILCGTILRHGLQHVIEEVFDEIHRSNMSKLGADGKPIYREDGKVLKGPDYFKPDIGSILERNG
jgi:predicted HAD superfamily Cof-like phosphohydrolase